METEFIYYRHRTPVGVKVEEVSGGEDRSGAVWRAIAMQVYCENGRDGQYRAIDHAPSGAPLLEPGHARVSVTHTSHLLVVATLPDTPDIDLEAFDPRTALGVDAEKVDREQVLRVRERFLSEEERALVPADEVEKHIAAWTAKEALWKAALTPGLDMQTDIHITRLPDPRSESSRGAATVSIPGHGDVEFTLYSYLTDGCMVTLALTPQTVTFLTNK